jgi:hypothetical protein
MCPFSAVKWVCRSEFCDPFYGIMSFFYTRYMRVLFIKGLLLVAIAVILRAYLADFLSWMASVLYYIA